jgi:hypothetical protein
VRTLRPLAPILCLSVAVVPLAGAQGVGPTKNSRTRCLTTAPCSPGDSNNLCSRPCTKTESEGCRVTVDCRTPDGTAHKCSRPCSDKLQPPLDHVGKRMLLPDGGIRRRSDGTEQYSCILEADAMGMDAETGEWMDATGRCYVPCWDHMTDYDRDGTTGPLCAKEMCCPDGCDALTLPQGGKCVWSEPPEKDTPETCRSYLAQRALKMRDLGCKSDSDCVDLVKLWGPNCRRMTEDLGPCPPPAPSLCPFDSQGSCIEGLCARRGEKDPAKRWDEFIKTLQKQAETRATDRGSQ